MWKREELNWKNQIQAVERLISAGKLSKAADALERALRYTRKAKSLKREVETLLMISVVQLQSNNPSLAETTQLALEIAEMAFGPESGFTARALLIRSCVKEISLTDEADLMVDRAALLYKSAGELEQLVHRLDYLVYSQILANNFRQALATLRRGLKYAKDCYGDSSTQVELMFQLYTDLMLKLGREHEIAAGTRKLFPELLNKYGGDHHDTLQALRSCD